MGTKVICIAPEGQMIDQSIVDTVNFQINAVKKSDCGRILHIMSPQPKSAVNMEVEGLDVFILNADAPPPKLLLADMDSTIVQSETLDDLAAHFDIQDKVAAITERAMRGEMDFHEALRARVSMLKGLPEAAIFDLLPNIKLSAGAESLIYTCKKNDVKTYLVSSGFTHVTGYIAEKLGFDGHFGNRFVISDGVLTGDVVEPIQDKTAKLRILNELCEAHDIIPDEVVAIGDGANDIPMLQAAGYGVAYKAKPAVIAATDMGIVHTDLSAVGGLYLHNY